MDRAAATRSGLTVTRRYGGNRAWVGSCAFGARRPLHGSAGSPPKSANESLRVVPFSELENLRFAAQSADSGVDDIPTRQGTDRVAEKKIPAQKIARLGRSLEACQQSAMRVV